MDYSGVPSRTGPEHRETLETASSSAISRNLDLPGPSNCHQEIYNRPRNLASKIGVSFQHRTRVWGGGRRFPNPAIAGTCRSGLSFEQACLGSSRIPVSANCNKVFNRPLDCTTAYGRLYAHA